MQVFIDEPLVGATYALDVSREDTVEELVTQIRRNRRGHSAEDQRLLHAGRVLQKDRTLADYNIQEFSTLSCVPSLRGGMQIFVKMLTEKTIRIEVQSDDTVKALMMKIMEKEGVGAEDMRLIYAGVQLREEKTLADYNIQKESTIFMVIRLRGGF